MLYFCLVVLAPFGIGALVDILSPLDGRMGVKLAAWKRALLTKMSR